MIFWRKQKFHLCRKKRKSGSHSKACASKIDSLQNERSSKNNLSFFNFTVCSLSSIAYLPLHNLPPKWVGYSFNIIKKWIYSRMMRVRPRSFAHVRTQSARVSKSANQRLGNVTQFNHERTGAFVQVRVEDLRIYWTFVKVQNV